MGIAACRREGLDNSAPDRSRLIRAMMTIVPANGRAALGRPPEAVPGSSEAARRRP